MKNKFLQYEIILGLFLVEGTAGSFSTLNAEPTFLPVKESEVMISQPDSALTILSVDLTDATCYGGTGTVNVNTAGGARPYTFGWSDQSGNSYDTSGDNPAHLPAGTWTVVVKDAKGTQLSATLTIKLISCTGFVTVTQADWGAKNDGSNKAWYLVNNDGVNFNQVFPNGLTVGCASGKTLQFITAESVHSFLPEEGTPAAIDVNYPGNSVNPQQIKNPLASQAVALTLTLGFGENDPGIFGSSGLGDLIKRTGGAFMGWTVNEILSEANRALGGCGTTYSFEVLTSVLDSINRNYEDGTVNNGLLACTCPCSCSLHPGIKAVIGINNEEIPESVASLVIYPNPIIDNSTVKFAMNYKSTATVTVYDINGKIIRKLYDGNIDAYEDYSVTLATKDMLKGIYIVRLVTNKNVQTNKVIIN